MTDRIDEALDKLDLVLQVVVINEASNREELARTTNLSIAFGVLLSVVLAALVSFVVVSTKTDPLHDFVFLDNAGQTQLCSPAEHGHYVCVVTGQQE